QSAALRHSVLAAAIVCSLVVPVIALVIPAWEFVYLKLPSKTSAIIHTKVDNGPDTSDGTGSAPAIFESPVLLSAETDTPVYVHHYGEWLWASGAVILAFFLSFGWLRLLSIAARSELVVRGKWIESAEHISREYGLRRRVRLFQSKSPVLLATWGLLHP